MEVFNKVLEFILGPVGLIVVGFLAEFIVRKYPTFKPASFFLVAKSIFNGLGKVCEFLDAAFSKVISQNIK